MGTSVIPSNLQVPAHLMATPERIAASNAAAAGGIKVGGFPSISIKGSKFHIKDAGEMRTITDPANPALPLMLLEVVFIGSNPRLSKAFYPGDYVEGSHEEPLCSADDGIRPDAHILEPQSPTCAVCPKNQWGSKISKASGKEVKACSDIKRLVLVPAQDIKFKALGLDIKPSSLKDWGIYVNELSKRNLEVLGVVTQLTFDVTASHPKLKFGFGRFLTPDEYAYIQQRALGDDVKQITNPRAPATPLLAAPTQTLADAHTAAVAAAIAPLLPGVILGAGPLPEPARAALDTDQTQTATLSPAGAPISDAAGVAAVLAAKRTRRTKAEMAAAAPANDQWSYLPAEAAVLIRSVGSDSPIGKVILAQYGPPAAAAPAPAAEAPQAAAPAAAPQAPAPAVAASGAFGGGTPGSATVPPVGVTTVAPPTAGAAAAAGSLSELLKSKLQRQATS